MSSTATDEEIKNAYRNLARKYHPDNYADDNPLKELANEKMQDINSAYEEIQRIRAAKNSGSYYSTKNAGYGSTAGVYYQAREALKAHRYNEAARLINEVPTEDRNAEWHFINCMILMNRGYTSDAMRELEIACNMDPGNYEYQKAKEMFNTASRAYGSTYYGGTGAGYRRSSTREDEVCNICANLMCLDCLCECMGGDIIPCI